MEKKIKHLEFIQNIISRISNISFLLKGWGITLLAALFALSAKDANAKFYWISVFVLIIFWILDSYFISVERRYRMLYDQVRNRDEREIDFNLNISAVKSKKTNLLACIFSKPLLFFYGSILIIVIFAFKFFV
jgi:hypothetical protein